MTKGSGGNGVNTVYQVGAAGALPTAATAATTPITVLPGFPTLTASGKPDVSTHPFGLWFGNATTLFVADEGDGTITDDTGHDLGADPNELVTITVHADGSASPFSVLETAAAGERLGGVAIAGTGAAVVPEPATYALVVTGLAMTGVLVRRRRTS
ncbi:MAG TPA: PEP-CTERM sorting domain-containing protein [Gemmatirosa sp.]